MASDWWELGDQVRVTDLIRMYKGASSATTHKAINELIKAKLFKVVANKEDKREKVLEKGTKFDVMEDDLKGWL
jgi:DNA-binding MarR family transcriptional regulator